MKLIEYLDKKYPGGSKGFTRAEAKLIGMPYPLQKGWVQKFGDVEVNEAQLMEAAQDRTARIEARKQKRAAKRQQFREAHGGIQQ